MEIETERLLLRNYKMMDIVDYLKLVKQEKVANRAGFDVINDDSAGLKALKRETQDPYKFAIVDKVHNRVVGEIGLESLSLDVLNLYGLNKSDRVKEICCCLSEDYWNQGVMTEAMSALVKVAFEKMDLDYIVGACYSKNKSSKMVQIKCGLIPYKTHKNYIWKETGETCKAILSKISKEQYKHINWYKNLKVTISDDNQREGEF